MIIGSNAIRFWFPEFNRAPKDLDIIKGGYNPKNIESDLRKEFLDNPVLVEYYISTLGYCPYYIGKNELLTLKMSHLFWDIHWAKHLFDIQYLLKKGCKLNKDLFYKLYAYWNTVHEKNKRSDLKMSADDFFNNAVKFPFEHDFLHEVLAKHEYFLGTPTYKKVLIGEVEVGEEKFNELSFKEKCSLVEEEVMCMALERYHEMDYRFAYERMLKKFIISHAPLWEAIFIIENYKDLYRPKFNFIQYFKQQLK